MKSNSGSQNNPFNIYQEEISLFPDANNKVAAKKARIKTFRKEASRLASIANKRVARLEKNNLQDSPAYQRYISSGGKFSVKGKTYREVQAETARLKKFIDSQTSTIRGINKNLRDMAKNTGIEYTKLSELRLKAGKFFELSSKVEQYLRTVEDMASAIGYQQIWEAINQYTKDKNIDLNDADLKMDGMIKAVTHALKEYDEPEQTISGWYSLNAD